MSVHEDIIESLIAYRDGYKRKHFDIPEHEIVIRPDKYAELMDGPTAIQNVDFTASERNYAGVSVIIESGGSPFVKVRDRTISQSDVRSLSKEDKNNVRR